MSKPPVDFTKLEEMKGIMGDIFAQLLPAYIEQSDEMISAMPELLSTGDIDVLERHAHSMKSSSLNVGAINLADIARELEELSRNKADNTLLKTNIELITNEYNLVREILQNYL